MAPCPALPCNGRITLALGEKVLCIRNGTYNMPRRNFVLLLVLAVVSLVCYQKVQRNHYGQILTEAMEQIDDRYLEDIGEEELFEGAMEGLIGRLDYYSAF